MVFLWAKLLYFLLFKAIILGVTPPHKITPVLLAREHLWAMGPARLKERMIISWASIMVTQGTNQLQEPEATEWDQISLQSSSSSRVMLSLCRYGGVGEMLGKHRLLGKRAQHFPCTCGMTTLVALVCAVCCTWSRHLATLTPAWGVRLQGRMSLSCRYWCLHFIFL